MRYSRALSFQLSLILCAVVGHAASPIAQFAKLPLAFEQRGTERYVAHGNGYAVSLQDGSAELRILGADGSASVVSATFAGARKVTGHPGAALPGVINYLHGQDRRAWQTGLSTYSRVKFEAIYPNIDVVYYGNQQQLEFDLELQPGADPGSIRLQFAGARSLTLAKDGALVVGTAAGDLRLLLPAIYQGDGVDRHAIAGHYRLLRNQEIGFQVERYDRTRKLVIDPTVVYAGIIGGGTSTATGTAIAVDAAGNTYVAGYTSAPDFPTVNAAFPKFQLGTDAFVSKIDPTGTTLLYSTYMGGGGTDEFFGIAVDSTGAAWVTGQSASIDFPTMGAYQSGLNGTTDAVVVKLDTNGHLQYSTYLGAAGTVIGRGVAVDSAGDAYVTGYLQSSGTVPATAGAYITAPQGGADAFAAKFDPNGALILPLHLGGSGDDVGRAIAVDSSGNAYVAGSARSPGFANAPGGGAQLISGGVQDGFVVKINPTGSALLYFTFIGGSALDSTYAIALDAAGNAYIAGITASSDFPVTAGVLQPVFGGGGEEGFAAKLNSTGSAFLYVTYLGGSRSDQINGLAIDATGDAYVTGLTGSANFPTVAPLEGSVPSNQNTTSLFQTTNAGSSWAAFDSNISGTVFDILPDPSVEGTAVALSDAGIYRTVNGGVTWSRTFFPDVNVFLNYGAGGLARSPADSNTIYFLYESFSVFNGGTASTVVYRSTDGGITWGSPGTLLATSGFSGLIVADPFTATTAYAASTSSTVYKTVDGGATWSTINTGLTSSAVLSFLAAADGSLYLGTNSAVYKSTNQGASWTSVSTGLTGTGVANGLTVSFSTPSVLYRSNGTTTIFKTSNGGTSWAAVAGAVPAAVSALKVSPANPLVVFAATAGASTLYASTDGGVTWNASSTGLGSVPPTPSAIVFDSVNSSTAYLVTPGLPAVGSPGGLPGWPFVAEINPDGTALVYSTYLTGTGGGTGSGIASYNGDAFVVGSALGLFPGTTTAWQSNPAQYSAFVARIGGGAALCAYRVSPLAQTIYSGAQTILFNVLAPSGCTWTASGNAAFASVAAGSSGTGTGIVDVTVTANTTGQARTVNLTIAGQTATVTQAPSSCSYSLSPASATVGQAGGPVQVALTTGAGCPWAVGNSLPFAVSVGQPASGAGSATVNLTVLPSAAPRTRTLSVPIGGTNLGITQSGYCTFAVSPATTYFPAAGGTGTVNVITQAGCDWTASSATGLTVNSGSPNVGNGTVNYTVAANTGAVRTLTVLSLDGQIASAVQLQPQGYVIDTFAGGQLPATSIAGAAAVIGNPRPVVADAAGNVYFTSYNVHVIYRVDPAGALTRVAGTGIGGFSGDHGNALSAQVNDPEGLAMDAAGTLYLADSNNQRIRKIDATGAITTIAGTGTSGFAGDGGAATSARLNLPRGLTVDGSGNVYIADTNNNRVRKLSIDGKISTIAGNGTAGSTGDNGPATSAELSAPYGLALDSAGNLYIADSGNFKVRKVSIAGTITTVAGTGVSGFTGDGGQATSARLGTVYGVVVDASGNLYVSDYGNSRIRKVATTGVITTVAGGASNGTGDGGVATSARLYNPFGVTLDRSNNLWIADFASQRIRRVSGGIITTVAGGAKGDTGPAALSGLNEPTGVVKDSSGNVYVADSADCRVRQIAPSGTITTIAGTGVCGFSGDGGLATGAQINSPQGLALDASGNLYIADSGNSRVRRMSVGGNIATVAGIGSFAYSGDTGPATSASLNRPKGLAVNASGLFIVDSSNNAVRKVAIDGTITTVAGTGTAGYSGDSGPATSAQMSSPSSLAIDGSGNLYVADTSNNRIRRISFDGTMTTVAGNGTAGFTGDFGPATSAELNSPSGLAIDAAGTLYIGDASNFRVRVVDSTGVISTIAGSGTYGYTGDGGPAFLAGFRNPNWVAVDNTGNVYVTDFFGNNVRQLIPVGGAPLLTVSSSHSGNFAAGSSAQYTVTVSNAALAGATNGGLITLTESLPSSVTIASMAGNGWTCGTNTCTRSEPLAGGASYPAITVSVNVASSAPSQATNQVTVAGGGSIMTVAEDLTVILTRCDVNNDLQTNITDLQSLVNQILGAAAAVTDLDGDGATTVVDLQVVGNAVLAQGCLAR